MINTLRHKEVFDSNEYSDRKITIPGVGAIGSRVFEALASTGLTNLHLIDYDVVEDHNLANQLFVKGDIDKPKVIACMDWAQSKGCNIADMTFTQAKLSGATPEYIKDTDILICCVDSFDARREVQQATTEAGIEMFVEAGMASQHMTTFMFNPLVPSKVRDWHKTLGDDNDPTYETSACGGSLTVGTTATIAGNAIAWNVMNYLKTGYVETKLRIDMSPFFVSRNDQR